MVVRDRSSRAGGYQGAFSTLLPMSGRSVTVAAMVISAKGSRRLLNSGGMVSVPA